MSQRKIDWLEPGKFSSFNNNFIEQDDVCIEERIFMSKERQEDNEDEMELEDTDDNRKDDDFVEESWKQEDLNEFLEQDERNAELDEDFSEDEDF